MSSVSDSKRPSANDDASDAASCNSDLLNPESAANVVDLDSIRNHARQIRDDAAALAAEVESTGDDLERYLTDLVRQHPLRTLGAAAGLGYVLGGGLRTPATVMFLGAATRIVAAQIVRELTGLAEHGHSADARPAVSTSSPIT